jgi:hypothetical protein
MKKSESIGNLAMALCQFQGEVTNPKNTAANPFFKSKYAPLSEVINTTKELMHKHGLSCLQSPSGDGEHIVITTLLMHSSGEWIEGEPLVLKADKVTAQGAGSAITYGRRYALSAILGIASEEDDDANHATGNKEQGKVEPIKQTATTKNEVNWVSFWNECKKLGYTMEEVQKIAGTKDFSKWTKEKASALFSDLKTKQLSATVGGTN